MNSKKLKDEVYLSSHQAGELLGYTHDYISRLCRQGHMVGDRRGREWFVKPSDIEDFKKRHEVVLQEKKKQLSQKLSEIRKEHEAQKRAQKQVVQAKIKTEETPVPKFKKPIPSSSALNASDVEIKDVKLSIPRQFVAIAVLACVLMLPAISNFISSAPIISINTDSINSLKSFQTAAVVDSLGSSMSELSIKTISTFSGIGHAYLFAYELQGPLTMQSFNDISSVGAITLSGYELIGDSFVQGVKNIFNLFSPSVEVGSDFSKKKLNWYVSSVEEGFFYAQNSLYSLYKTIATTYVIDGAVLITKNMQTNISEMNSIVQSGSTILLGNISSIFESNFSKKESSQIIKISN